MKIPHVFALVMVYGGFCLKFQKMTPCYAPAYLNHNYHLILFFFTKVITSFVEFFLYTDVARANPGDVADFILPQLNRVSVYLCLEFYFHMYGPDVGKLSVIEKAGENETEVFVAEKVGGKCFDSLFNWQMGIIVR